MGRRWEEHKHPRDDRGRFAKRAGRRWAERVLTQMSAGRDMSAGGTRSGAPSGRIDLAALVKENVAFHAPKTPQTPTSVTIDGVEVKLPKVGDTITAGKHVFTVDLVDSKPGAIPYIGGVKKNGQRSGVFVQSADSFQLGEHKRSASPSPSRMPTIKASGAAAQKIEEQLKLQQKLIPRALGTLKSVVVHKDQRSWAEGLRRVTALFGSARVANSLAIYGPFQREVHVSPRTIADLHADGLWAKRTGFVSRVDDEHIGLGSTIAHETGHHVYMGLTHHKKTKLHKLFLMTYGGPSQQSAVGSRSEVAQWLKKNRGTVEVGISKYATTDLDEMFAEIWREYSASSQPRPKIKKIGEEMRRLAEGGR